MFNYQCSVSLFVISFFILSQHFLLVKHFFIFIFSSSLVATTSISYHFILSLSTVFLFYFSFLFNSYLNISKNIATAVCSDIYNIILFKNCQYIFHFISKSFNLSSLPLSYLIHNSFAIPGTGSDFMLICIILLRIPVPQENF